MNAVAVENDVTPHCPICTSTHFHHLGARSEYAQNTKTCFRFEFDDVMCDACGFVFSRNRPRKSYLDRYYADYFPSLSQISNDEVNARIAAIRRHASLDIDILEYGGGFSAFSEALRSHGARVSSLDPSLPDSVGALKFDLVCSYYVGEHITEIDAWMQEQFSYLRESGKLLIEVPNFSEHPLESMNNEHVNHFKLTDLARLFAKHGFKVIDQSGTGSRYFGMWAVGVRSPAPVCIPLDDADKERSRDAYRSYIDERSAVEQHYNKVRTKTLDAIANGEAVAVWPCNVITTRLLIGLTDEDRSAITPFDISPEKQGIIWPGTSSPVRYPDPDAIRACQFFILCSPTHNVRISDALAEQGVTEDRIIHCAA